MRVACVYESQHVSMDVTRHIPLHLVFEYARGVWVGGAQVHAYKYDGHLCTWGSAAKRVIGMACMNVHFILVNLGQIGSFLANFAQFATPNFEFGIQTCLVCFGKKHEGKPCILYTLFRAHFLE